VVKGASAIEYGSDALGGVVNISNNDLPVNGEFAGTLSMLAKSVNHTLGGSFMVKQRHNKFFYKLRGSMLSFGDYAIPTDTIVYLTQKMPIYNRHLKNSAGNEFDLNGQWGIIGTRYKTVLTLTNVAQKSGFFPGAHGIPNIEKLAHDGNTRNIEFPFQQVNHFKAISNTKWFWHETVTYVDMGFQRNHRQEWSSFHTHYPGQEAPANHPDLELDFLLNTYSINAKTEITSLKNHVITAGIQNQLMHNTVGGYSFFLPEYKRFTTGVFVKDAYTVSENTKLFLGLRFDYGLYSGAAFFDSLVYRYVSSLPGRTIADAEMYAQRSIAVKRTFPGTSWQMGATQKLGAVWLLRLNAGKAFRIPTAVELGANGVHHGSYRFEKGDENLKTETGYNSDVHVEWTLPDFQMGLGVYAYYFNNYLYLQPTGDLNHPIPDAGGIYYYKQSKALLSGAEFSVVKTFWAKITLDANIELPYNYLITDAGTLGYGIPYSPPVNGYWQLKYQPGRIISFAVTGKWATAKDRNRGQGEPETPGYNVFGCSILSEFIVKGQPINLIFQIQNALNTKYYNSMSFYRKLDIPEQGRNVQLVAKIPFVI
jgi:iron complex outermembrane receptor protein